MNMKTTKSWGRWAGQALVLGVTVGALAACDDLLEADIPHLLTDDALAGSGTAGTQVASIQALYECGASTFGWVALGHEDVLESVAGVSSTSHVYRTAPVTGTCDGAGATQSWFDQMMGARALNSNADGNGVYDKLESGEFDLGATGERLQAIGAFYHAAALLHFGQYFCEGALDGSAPMSDTDFLADALTWVNRIAGHESAAGGSVSLPNNAGDLDNATVGLRAQILLAQGNLSGAANEAVNYPDGEVTWITRESGEQRRNKYNAAGNFSGTYGVIDWWDPADRTNPATGNDYPDPIPFTGYVFLGFGPEGETLDDNNLPIRWAEEFRALGDAPTALAGFDSDDADTRVLNEKEVIQGPEPREVQVIYNDDADNIPMIHWWEMRLIEAMDEAVSGSAQNAIDLINEIRADAGVRQISGAYETDLSDGTLANGTTIREVVFEEARRALYVKAAGCGLGSSRTWTCRSSRALRARRRSRVISCRVV